MDLAPNVAFSLGNVIIPIEGPKTVPATLDFNGTNGTFNIDGSQLVLQAKISYIQTIFVDNFDNPNPLFITTDLINQRIVVPANSQMYVPILEPNPPTFTFTTITGNFKVKVQFLNVPIQPMLWSDQPSTSSASAGGAIATNVVFPECAALLCSADTVADITFADGTVVAGVPLQKGYNPIRAINAIFAAGTIIALRN